MNDFAREWLHAWNTHDLEAIMTHYAPDIVFYSPFIQQINNDPTGCIRGKEALKAYFKRGLDAYPELYFEPYHVLDGVHSVVIYYKSVKEMLSTEMMVLNEDGKVCEVRAHYTAA
ncbi:SnoaL-like domain-containing protein [Chitinophaga sp. YR627]|uniref:nuclear transport factor 2 family protein n=1 Tax=Chitinophaga sp. YR627 TaxID=1881041 RepID=UPI0008E4E203|nr:nuclear transport factor 2 family protein [Chitinophaga sp. YR627]SFO30590.1 SnoaL-like domain-containing protein [Chitinophaga sp. YR627]